MLERTMQLWLWACVLVGLGILLLLGPPSVLAAEDDSAEDGARTELLQLERTVLTVSSRGDGGALESLLAEG